MNTFAFVCVFACLALTQASPLERTKRRASVNVPAPGLAGEALIDVLTRAPDILYSDHAKKLTALKSSKYGACFIKDLKPDFWPLEEELRLATVQKVPEVVRSPLDYNTFRRKVGQYIGPMCGFLNNYWLDRHAPPSLPYLAPPSLGVEIKAPPSLGAEVVNASPSLTGLAPPSASSSESTNNNAPPPLPNSNESVKNRMGPPPSSLEGQNAPPPLPVSDKNAPPSPLGDEAPLPSGVDKNAPPPSLLDREAPPSPVNQALVRPPPISIYVQGDSDPDSTVVRGPAEGNAPQALPSMEKESEVSSRNEPQVLLTPPPVSVFRAQQAAAAAAAAATTSTRRHPQAPPPLSEWRGN